jgi:hypothetical protein
MPARFFVLFSRGAENDFRLMRWLILILLLASCGDARRFARILKRHPEWLKTDSVMVIKTIRVDSSVHDTTFMLRPGGDTTFIFEDSLVRQVITIYKDRLRTRTLVKQRFLHDTVYQTSTVIQAPKVPGFWSRWWERIPWRFLFLAAAAVFFLSLFRRKK